ncbi:glycosyltransferase family 2 protein [Cellulomonas sp. NPDC058312]|uniref:glycosyltransferase family 2 protein n=1 Tax=Cellulomonas sp. NPDC058312 TaxID=3346441 RepID=UPI0036F1438E
MTGALAGSGAARAVVTLCSGPRVAHLRRQLAALRAVPRLVTVVVWVGDDPPPADLGADAVLRVPPGPHGLRLAAARNAGADHAVRLGADLLVLLDADCVPGPVLLDRYEAAAATHGSAVLCGPVTYLPAGAVVDDPAALVAATRPHPARPAPPDGAVLTARDDEYDLFWSLSFALTADRWRDGPRFSERYEGYGGEDTDFAASLRAAGVPLAWVGGAHAYHQHHPTSSPPWQHLDDILRNGATFADRWGRWPMEGWLRAFAEHGAVRWDGRTWRRTQA